MIEITFYGRGGRGAALAAQILADAAAKKEGRFSHAFPFFGSERRGAPVKSFVRIDARPIKRRCQIKMADILVIFTESLLEIETPDYKLENNLKESGLFLINSQKQPSGFNLSGNYRIVTFDATTLARKYGLGRKIPIVNTIMLGVFTAIKAELVELDHLIESAKFNLPGEIEKNLKAMQEAYETCERLEADDGKVT